MAVLSSQQFEAIVGQVDSAPEDDTASRVMLPDGTCAVERRKETRIPIGQRAKVRVNESGDSAEWNTVMLQDISVQSVSFLSDVELVIDTPFTLCLKDLAGKLVTIRSTVRRCEAGGFGGTSFAIAARFEELLNDVPDADNSAAKGSSSQVADPFEAYGGTSTRPRPHSVSRVLNSFNPVRLWSHLTKEYDDFSTSSSGSKLTDESLAEIARTMASDKAPRQPKIHAIESVPSTSPRRSSIFLHTDDPTPAAITPVLPISAPIEVEAATIIPPAAPSPTEVPMQTIEAPPEPMDTAPIEPAPIAVVPVESAAAAQPPSVVEPQESPEVLDFLRWTKRSLAGKRYVYMWGAELSAAEPANGRILVLFGAAENAEPELLALHSSIATAPIAWKQLLVNLMRRGLTKPPSIAIGERSIGFWDALAEFSPATSVQYSWDTQIAGLLVLLPKGSRRLAEKELLSISTMANVEEAIKSLELLAQDFQTDAPDASARINQDKAAMFAFHHFPAEHHALLRTGAVLKSISSYQRDQSKPLQVTLAEIWKNFSSATESRKAA